MASEGLKKEIQNALDNATLSRTLGNFCKTYPGRRENSYSDVAFDDVQAKIKEVKTYGYCRLSALLSLQYLTL